MGILNVASINIVVYGPLYSNQKRNILDKINSEQKEHEKQDV